MSQVFKGCYNFKGGLLRNDFGRPYLTLQLTNKSDKTLKRPKRQEKAPTYLPGPAHLYSLSRPEVSHLFPKAQSSKKHINFSFWFKLINRGKLYNSLGVLY